MTTLRSGFSRVLASPWRAPFVIWLGASLIFLVHLGFQIWGFSSAQTDGEKYDCAIVLGASVTDAGPSPVFKARLDHGIELYKARTVSTLIFTGGVGKGDRLSEAEVASRYARKNQVPKEGILIETSSTTTIQNLAHAKVLMDKSGLRTAVIVSDPLHLHRSLMIARWLEIDAVASATPGTRYTTLGTKLPFLFREMYFTLCFRLFRS